MYGPVVRGMKMPSMYMAADRSPVDRRRPTARESDRSGFTLPVPRMPLMSKFGVRCRDVLERFHALELHRLGRECGDRDRRVLQRGLAALGRDDDLFERGALREHRRRAANQCCDGRCDTAATTN